MSFPEPCHVPPARLGVPPLTRAPAPGGAYASGDHHQPTHKWPAAAIDLRLVLASINPNDFRFSPAFRRAWNGLLTPLAWELARRGVQPPPAP